MRLHDLISEKGGYGTRKRVGRGRGSGHGKTSGRGHKGQRSRSGSGMRPGFESGHIPLYRKLPKRGFSNFRYKTEYAIINVGDLEPLEGVEEINREVLIKAGLVRDNKLPLKILGTGDLSRAIKVEAEKFTATAKAKIEKAGGEALESSKDK